MGAKQSTGASWKDCPAYDLEPIASRTASVSVSITRLPRSRKGSACADHPQQPQASSSGAQQPAAAGALTSPAATTSAATTMQPTASTSVARDAHSDVDVDSPYRDAGGGAAGGRPASRERAHIQHRLALRLLERKGALAESGIPPKGPVAPGSESAPLPQVVSGRGAGAFAAPSTPGSSYASPQGTVPPSPAPSSGYYTPVGISPNGAGPGSGGCGGADSAVEADERMCAGGDLDDGVSVAGPLHSQAELIYRRSGPGLPGASPAAPALAANGNHVWGGAGKVVAQAGPGMRSSDYGGGAGPGGGGVAAAVMASSASASAAVGPTAPLIGPRTVPPPPLLVLPAGGLISPTTPATPATPPVGLAVAEGVQAQARAELQTDRPSDRHRFTPRAWSAAGGRQELSQEEKEWLFGRPGGIGGLPPVLALGEGGEGLVDLVRLDLPGRTVHLARKATRTSVPSFALNGGSGPMLGITRNVAYRFPFECFDREVRAMKAVKESGFVIRFQAAAYDHDKGQGYILMEAAPYGTLQDLHNALCRSTMQSAARQRAPLLQRALAKFSTVGAKASAPPSLAPPGGGGTGGGGRYPQSLNVVPDRQSRAARPGGGGIGSCGGGGHELVQLAPEAEADTAYGGGGGGTGCSDRFSCCSASTLGSPEQERGGRSSAHAATAPASPGLGSGVGAGLGSDGGAAGGGLGSIGSSLMSCRALRYYGACMLQALVALHDAGYVYRDLKLSNVLVCEGGRVRLTDFGAAATCLSDQPGLFGGVAGTRLYLAPELLPWLDAPPPGEGSGRSGRGARVGPSGGGGGPAPYTVTIDSWTWGLVMVELATGWSIKELTQRVIRRVCHPRTPQPPDLPADCGLPPLLRQLLLDHVLVRDPAARWSAVRIKTHRFFEGLDWERLADMEGPHAHLFVGDRRASDAMIDASPGDVAAAMRVAGADKVGGGRKGGVLAAGNPVAYPGPGGGEMLLQWGGSPLGGPGSYVMASNPGAAAGPPGQGNSQTSVVAFTGQRSSGGGGGRSSRPQTGNGVLPVPPMVLPPGSFASMTAATGEAAAAAAAAVAAAVTGGGSQRPSALGYASGGPVAERYSSPGNGPLIGPVVPPVAASFNTVGSGLGPRRHTTNLGMGVASRLAAGTTAA